MLADLHLFAARHRLLSALLWSCGLCEAVPGFADRPAAAALSALLYAGAGVVAWRIDAALLREDGKDRAPRRGL